jgi:hypothetical protein
MVYRVLLTIGILLFLVASVILKQSLAFVAGSERATGTVIKLEAFSGDGGDSYAPVFKIVTSKNQEIIYRHSISTSPASWDIGQQATFLYDPVHPSDVRLSTYFGVFNWSIVLMGAAVFLLTTGGSYFLLRRYLQVPCLDEKGDHVI